MAHGPLVEQVQGHFEAFTRAVVHLPLYRRLSEGISGDPEVRDLLLAARPGQARPVLLLAAVHDLLLRNPELPAARWYASITPGDELAPGDPYPAFRQAALDHAEELRQVIATHNTQTNEVNRCVLLGPLVAAALADDPDRPIALVELGCSAGLLLGMDRYRIDVGGVVMGDPGSPVSLAGVLDGGSEPPTSPFPPHPDVEARLGIDLAPIALDDVDRLRWIEACLWPDQPLRVGRFRAAVELMKHDPPRLVQGDLIEALPEAAAALPPGAHLVVYHCWALTYIERSRRDDLAAVLTGLAAQRHSVSWLSAEPPNAVPGIVRPPLPPGDEASRPETVLGLRRWRNGTELAPAAPGWGHPHGESLTWLT
jgi:hypothetical protein